MDGVPRRVATGLGVIPCADALPHGGIVVVEFQGPDAVGRLRIPSAELKLPKDRTGHGPVAHVPPRRPSKDDLGHGYLAGIGLPFGFLEERHDAQ